MNVEGWIHFLAGVVVAHRFSEHRKTFQYMRHWADGPASENLFFVFIGMSFGDLSKVSSEPNHQVFDHLHRQIIMISTDFAQHLVLKDIVHRISEMTEVSLVELLHIDRSRNQPVLEIGRHVLTGLTIQHPTVSYESLPSALQILE